MPTKVEKDVHYPQEIDPRTLLIFQICTADQYMPGSDLVRLVDEAEERTRKAVLKILQQDATLKKIENELLSLVSLGADNKARVTLNNPKLRATDYAWVNIGGNSRRIITRMKFLVEEVEVLSTTDPTLSLEKFTAQRKEVARAIDSEVAGNSTKSSTSISFHITINVPLLLSLPANRVEEAITVFQGRAKRGNGNSSPARQSASSAVNYPISGEKKSSEHRITEPPDPQDLPALEEVIESIQREQRNSVSLDTLTEELVMEKPVDEPWKSGIVFALIKRLLSRLNL